MQLLTRIIVSTMLVGLNGPISYAEEDKELPLPVVVRTMRSSLRTSSLPHLLELTERHSPNLRKAKNSHDVANLEFENASRQWFPSLDMQTAYGLHDSKPRNDNTPVSTWASSVSVVASEKLYDNGIAITQYQIAKHKLERSLLEFQLARDLQLLNVTNAYYDWSAASQQRDILDNKMDLLRKQLSVIEAHYKQGLKTKRDVLRIETEIRRLEMDLVGSDNEIDLNFQKLASFVGMERADLAKESLEVEESKLAITIPAKGDGELKAKDHQRAKIYALQSQEAALETRLIQRNYWPQVALDGTFGYFNHDYVENPAPRAFHTNHRWDWSALVTVKYNLWDFGRRRRQMEIARIKERTVTDQNAQALFDLGNDLRNVLLQLNSYRENVKMTRDLLVLEQQAYSILEAEYRSGRTSYLDLITNLNSYIDARAKFISSYFGLKKQQELYRFHQGHIYDSLKQNN